MSIPESVQDVLDRARSVYLNDASGALFTNATMLPHAKAAYDQFETGFARNNLAFLNGMAYIPVKTPDKVLNLPGNFAYPIELKERNLGASLATDFSLMSQRNWDPTRDPTDRLINWIWREGAVHFVGATTDREVLISYQEMFPTLKDGTSIVRGDALAYLAAKTAAYVHLFVNQNETLAKVADDIAEGNLEDLIRINVKRSQALGVRRRPYRPFAR